jgi:hypothetical protein
MAIGAAGVFASRRCQNGNAHEWDDMEEGGGFAS